MVFFFLLLEFSNKTTTWLTIVAKDCAWPWNNIACILIFGVGTVFHGVKSAEASNTNQYKMTLGSLEVLCNEIL